MPTKKKKDKQDFAKSYSELEKIIEEFESGEINLEEGVKKFEKGLSLAVELKKQLEEVENRVETIKVKFKDLET
jgi:exodeoxyribonuclease VII small subunit